MLQEERYTEVDGAFRTTWTFNCSQTVTCFLYQIMSNFWTWNSTNTHATAMSGLKFSITAFESLLSVTFLEMIG